MLKTATVLIDAHVAAGGGAELLREKELTTRRVVVEVRVQTTPDEVGGGLWWDDDIEELTLDRGEEPQDDRVVVVQPGRVTETMLVARLDVVEGVEPGEKEANELAPP